MLKIKFIKRPDQGDEIMGEFTFKSKRTVALNERDVKQTLKDQQEDILEQIKAFIRRRTEWHIDKIIAFYVNISKHQAVR